MEGAGLAGSAADLLAGGAPLPSSAGGPPSGDAAALAGAAGGAAAADAPPDDDLAGLAQGRPTTAQITARIGAQAYPQAAATGRRPSVSSTRPSGDVISGPAWEGDRRYEAYPTIRSRGGLPGMPRIAVLAGALGIAALALFMLPALLGIGGGSSPGGSPSPGRPAATASAEITPQPAPTAQLYVIKQKDTLSKVAQRFGLTLEELLAANPDIKNADKISIGQQIIIPLPVVDGAAPSASAAT